MPIIEFFFFFFDFLRVLKELNKFNTTLLYNYMIVNKSQIIDEILSFLFKLLVVFMNSVPLNLTC